MAFRIAASGASPLNSILPFRRPTPSSLHGAPRSTGAGVAFIFSYRSRKTGTSVAGSPISNVRASGQSDSIVPPALRMARSAPSRPFSFPVRLRISISARKQKSAPPQYVRPHVGVKSSRDRQVAPILAGACRQDRPTLSGVKSPGYFGSFLTLNPLQILPRRRKIRF
jgi:hypothetical protein